MPNYFQATGRSKYSVVMNLMRQVVIFLVVVIVFSNVWKLEGVWIAQPFTDFIFFLVLLVFLYREKRFFDKMTENQSHLLEFKKIESAENEKVDKNNK